MDEMIATPKMDNVICPNCAHQFQAISFDHQCELAAYEAEMPEALYVVFDGPPSHKAGRFVEVENAQGKSVSVGEWKPNRNIVYWQLGPFYTDALAKHCARLTVERDAAQRVIHAAQEIRIDFASIPLDQQAKWIHLPALRTAIDAALAAGKEKAKC